MEYSSNVDTVIDGLIGRLTNLKSKRQAQREVGSMLLASNLRRIHNDGKDVSGARIGSYSTSPILIGAKSFTTKAAATKAFAQIKRDQKKASKIIAGASKWVTIKGNHLAELEGGYKKIRELEGKRVDTVNLNRTGTLQDDLSMAAEGNDYVIGFRSKYGKDLREYIEKRYSKKIWGATKEDQKIAHEIVERIVKKELNKGA